MARWCARARTPEPVRKIFDQTSPGAEASAVGPRGPLPVALSVLCHLVEMVFILLHGGVLSGADARQHTELLRTLRCVA